jgi:hypothetical protein
MNLRPQTLQTKQTVVIVNRTPGWKLMRQHTPRTTGSIEVEDGVDYFLHADRARPTAGFGWWNKWFYELPLLIRQIAWIWCPFHIYLYRLKTAIYTLFTHALRENTGSSSLNIRLFEQEADV